MFNSQLLTDLIKYHNLIGQTVSAHRQFYELHVLPVSLLLCRKMKWSFGVVCHKVMDEILDKFKRCLQQPDYDVNAIDADGQTALMHAVRHVVTSNPETTDAAVNLEKIKLLLRHQQIDQCPKYRPWPSHCTAYCLWLSSTWRCRFAVEQSCRIAHRWPTLWRERNHQRSWHAAKRNRETREIRKLSRHQDCQAAAEPFWLRLEHNR